MDFTDNLPGAVEEAAGSLPDNLLTWIIVAAVAVAVLYVVRKAMRGRKPKIELPDLEHSINVPALGEAGPPRGGPTLEFSHVPVRLAAVVLAPAGAARELPPENRLNDLFEAVAPGLASVVAVHRPLIRRWPNQISTAGFPHKFFAKAKLPGDVGKATPWCSAAGVCNYQNQPFLVGLVMCAASDNSHSVYTIEHAAKWLDLLRIKASGE